jgi:hypothetical protein
MIAHEEAPREGWLVFRRCSSPRCVNPSHHDQARDQAEIGAFVASQGRRKGTHIESKRACAAMGRAAQGLIQVDDSIVLAIAKELMENGYPRGSGLAIAKRHGVNPGLVSRIAIGQRVVPGIGKLNLKQFSFRAGANAGRNPASVAALRRGFEASKRVPAP